MASTAKEIEIIRTHMPMLCNKIRHDLLRILKLHEQKTSDEYIEVQTQAPEIYRERKRLN